jgi:hypothetical protein
MQAFWLTLMALACLLVGCRETKQDATFRLVVSPPQALKPARVEVVASNPTVFSPRSRDEWESILTLSVDGQTSAVDGAYEVESDKLIYTSRFSLTGGVSYRVKFDPSKLLNKPASPIVETFSVAKPVSKPRTIVTRIYPSSDVLPCNQLKFYIFFSHPMREGEVFENAQILDKDDKPIGMPFREVELWNEDNTRLTLYLHPGRIKRGVALREEMGPILQPHQTYTLVIGKGLVDAGGNFLAAPFRKAFRTISDDRAQPDINQWKLTPPQAGTTQPLTIRFNEILDYALLRRMIWVETSNGQRVAGKVSVDDHERCWRFTPQSAWAIGTYRVVVDTLLEDMAGNSLGKPFEVDTAQPPPKMPPTVALTFSPSQL